MLGSLCVQVPFRREGAEVEPTKLASLLAANLSSAQARCDAALREVASTVAEAVEGADTIEVVGTVDGDAAAQSPGILIVEPASCCWAAIFEDRAVVAIPATAKGARPCIDVAVALAAALEGYDTTEVTRERFEAELLRAIKGRTLSPLKAAALGIIPAVLTALASSLFNDLQFSVTVGIAIGLMMPLLAGPLRWLAMGEAREELARPPDAPLRILSALWWLIFVFLAGVAVAGSAGAIAEPEAWAFVAPGIAIVLSVLWIRLRRPYAVFEDDHVILTGWLRRHTVRYREIGSVDARVGARINTLRATINVPAAGALLAEALAERLDTVFPPSDKVVEPAAAIARMRERLSEARPSLPPRRIARWARTRLRRRLNWEAIAEPGLLDHGRVVWGYLVWPVRGHDDPVCPDGPAIAVYSPEAWADNEPDALAQAALSLRAEVFEGRRSTLDRFLGDLDWRNSDAIRRGTAVWQSVDFECSHVELHKNLTQDRKMLATRVWIKKRSLPFGRLRQHLVPLLVDPERDPAVMVLPWQFWDPPTIASTRQGSRPEGS